MSWGFVAVAGATLVGSAVSSNAQKSAAKKQQQSAQNELELQKQMFDEQKKLLEPFRQTGLDALNQLPGIAQPLDRNAELAAYYQSPEFMQMSDVARNQQLASAEATGGLGSTSTGNALASIAPQLGQSYLAQRTAQQSDLYNQLFGLANIGLSGAGSQSAAAGAFGSQAANIMNQSAAQQAQAQLANAQLWGNTIGSLGGLGFSYLNQPKVG
ncbi:hypothetical protein ZP9_00014 [Shewanella phage ZP9]|nr:hypothetical protein ZP9_00014 [Shewanella phage ZP9]